MRALVFLLILANLLFLAWAQGYFSGSSDPDAFRMQQQLLADQITIVARDEAPAEVVKVAKPAQEDERKAADSCLLLADLPVADSDRVATLLSEKWPDLKAQRTTVDGSANYLVYIPPLANKQEADNKAAELKKLRVPEFYIVQESGPYKWAISLGLFSTKEAAGARLDALRSLGVKSAKVGERNVKPATAQLEIRGLETQVEALRQTLVEVLPAGRPIACRKPAQP